MSEPILCPECGHNIGEHDGWGCGCRLQNCPCLLSPSDIEDRLRLTAERDALKAALEWYANSRHYPAFYDGHYSPEIIEDGGDIARDALNKLDK